MRHGLQLRAGVVLVLTALALQQLAHHAAAKPGALVPKRKHVEHSVPANVLAEWRIRRLSHGKSASLLRVCISPWMPQASSRMMHLC